jgi:HD-like signal output (HDOD) protein/DNA-binding NarL/FixJ family response regulator
LQSILVVDDMPIFREPIAASLRSAGYEAQCAADGEQALLITRATHPDLILLDLAMPGMDGIAFLRHLRSDPEITHTKVILLTMVNDKNRVLAARALGVRDYILKSYFRLDDLLERIGRSESSGPAVADLGQGISPDCSRPKSSAGHKPVSNQPVEVPQLLTREQFLERVKHVFQAKTLSGVVADVVSMAGSPRGDATQMATLISRDPMLAARVLQAANSAMYASRGPAITTIPDAIRKVGFTTVRNIGAALGVFEHMPEASADGFNPIRYWQHSFAVAQISERLSGGRVREQGGLAYIVGLCHDLGEIFMHTEFGNEYHQVAEIALQTGKPRAELYGQMLGITPAQMVSAILKSMSLPDAIREPIELVNSPNGLQSRNPLVRILWMAENYANGAMLASGPSSEVAPLTQSFCQAATGEPNPPRPDPQPLRAEVLALTTELARLSRADEQKLLSPMFKPFKRKLWIARESGVSEFDPITLACESLAQVSVNNHLPADRELDCVDGLLVIASSFHGYSSFKTNIDIILDKVCKAGQELPVLCVACGQDSESQNDGAIPWRTSVKLTELAEFARSLGKGTSK